jgi:DNA-binding CsgD family transcriptional regulator
MNTRRTAPPELLGRKDERARIDARLDDARAGRSSALVVCGEAGIGKSTLLRYAAARADGMAVLSAAGVESEAELPFAALADFLSPALGHLDALPEPQAAALAGALALGPPVGADRFVACAATMGLLAAFAEAGPVVGVIDEAQWLDPSSLEALLFTARRIEAEGIALFFAVRGDGGGSLAQAGLEELPLSGLGEGEAQELISRAVETAPSPSLVERLVRATGGNPLALLEIPAVLSDAQLTGEEPLEDLPLTPSIERALLGRVAPLRDETRRALVVAAASESNDFETVAAAVQSLGIEADALGDAEEAGVIRIENARIEFRHALLRSAIYRAAPGALLQAAHHALAATMAASGAEQSSAWHLAVAAPTPDERIAAALEGAAFDARSRGGHAEAASAFERAARLTPEPEARARRLREAADDARLAGRAETALELLDFARESTAEPSALANIAHLRGAVEMWHGAPKDARESLVAHAERISESDPRKAARMLTDAAWASFLAADIGRGRSIAERASDLARGSGGATEVLAGAAVGIAHLLSGEADLAAPLLARYRDAFADEAAPVRGYQLLRPSGQVLTWVEQYDAAGTAFTRTIAAARSQGALGTLPFLLAGLSDLEFRTGAWALASAHGAEAVQIAEDMNETTMLAYALACRARVDAGLGRDECRQLVERAVELGAGRIGAVVAYAFSALGLFELAKGRNEEAVRILDGLAGEADARGLREPSVVQWAPDLVEAYARSGRRDEAERALKPFEALAEATGRTWAQAASARCRGLLAADADYQPAFEEALTLHGLTTTPFELARTQLCFGERLRRGRRRADAREPLRHALETFEQLGARPWAERARTELAATGETARPRNANAADELTPQELQIALVVANGATNKEAGAALFLSPKTIESHLSRVYRKLDVRSRTELVRRLVREGAIADQPA